MFIKTSVSRNVNIKLYHFVNGIGVKLLHMNLPAIYNSLWDFTIFSFSYVCLLFVCVCVKRSRRRICIKWMDRISVFFISIQFFFSPWERVSQLRPLSVVCLVGHHSLKNYCSQQPATCFVNSVAFSEKQISWRQDCHLLWKNDTLTWK